MKTKYFMFIYIAVLAVSPILCALYDSEFLNNLACAATISGYWFAVCDWNNTFANEWKRYRLSSPRSQKKRDTLLYDFRSMIFKIDNANQQIIEMYDKKGWPDALDRKVYIKIKKHDKKLLKIMNSYFDKNGNLIDFELKTQKRFEILSTISFIVGLLAFFVIVFVEPICDILSNHQNICSIYGCVIVLLNYYYSDSADERLKDSLNRRKSAMKSFEKRCEEFKLYCEAYDCITQAHD